MDKRVKILLIVFLALIVLSGAYYGYMSMSASEEVEMVAAAPKPKKKAPAPEAAPTKAAPETGQPTPEAAQTGKPTPAPAPVPGKPAPTPAPAAVKPVPAPAPYESVIKTVENGKEAVYKTPEEFLSKTKLAEPDIKAISGKMTADAEKSTAEAAKKKDKAAIDNARLDADMAARLAKAVTEKFPPQPTAQGAVLYSSLGKRDPFMSPLEVPKVYPNVPATASPLERVPTETLTVTAIMWNAKGYRALVVTPDGRGFTVKAGDTLGDKKGKITKITDKRIFVVEKIGDILGDVETRNIVLTLHKEAR